jgi:hypothetical protein
MTETDQTLNLRKVPESLPVVKHIAASTFRASRDNLGSGLDIRLCNMCISWTRLVSPDVDTSQYGPIACLIGLIR